MAEGKKINLLNIWFGTEKVHTLIPGVMLAVLVTILAMFLKTGIGKLIPALKGGISTVMLAILLGLIVRNIFHVPEVCQPGIKFTVKKLLKLGIILMGIRLSILAVLKIGSVALFVVILTITSAILITTYIAKKMKVERRLGTLIATGTGICGVSAIVATGPAIEAKEEEVAYAVGTITIFGMIVTFLYPYLTNVFLHLSIVQAGMFLGTAVHDTSQVTAASLIYDQLWVAPGIKPTAADIAITTKLIRNIFMVAVIPIMAMLYHRGHGESEKKKLNIKKLFPVFVLGFVVMAIVRSIGDYLIVERSFFGNPEIWQNLCSLTKHWAANFLAVALAGAGLGTAFKKLKALGIKPFFVGLIAAFAVGGVSFILVKSFGHFLENIF